MRKQTPKKKLILQKETLASLVGGYSLPDEGTVSTDTVYSKRPDCVPLTTKCPSADTRCTACVA